MNDPLSWFVLAASLLTFLIWADITLRSLHSRRLRLPPPDLRASYWTVTVGISGIFVVTSLFYFGAFGPDQLRVLLLAARAILLTTGIVAWLRVR